LGFSPHVRPEGRTHMIFDCLLIGVYSWALLRLTVPLEVR
jgi:hypothetical protein